MRKAAILGTRQAGLIEAPIPKPKENWALVKAHAAPMGTEYKGFVAGRKSEYLGHEAVGEVVDIGSRLELFVDDFLVGEMERVDFQLQHPERREVVLCCDAPWEDDVSGFLSVFKDNETVHLYYRASILDRSREDHQVIALAQSTNGGKTFSRPDLGIVEFAGSKKNNILMTGGPPRIPPAFIDTNPACEPKERYKGLSSKWRALYAMCSADGIHWRPMSEEPLSMEGTFDTVNTAFWDSQTECYRCFTRYFENLVPDTPEAGVLGRNPTVVRAIQSSTSQDFLNWTPVVHHRYDDGYENMQLYTNATIPCPGAEHIYLSFPNRYVQERIVRPNHPYPGVNDALFMASRDCVNWKRYAEAWVRPGLDHLNWTDRNNYPTWGLVETSATEWSIYISEHYRHPGTPPRLRRLAIRPHGFVSIHADFVGGQFVTKPLIFSGRQLRLNYSTSAAGFVQVEIQDPQGKPLAGFTLHDMNPVFGDELDAPMEWAEGGDISALIGKPVRLRFVLRDADVFAFRTA